jgi:hypothetical protein
LDRSHAILLTLAVSRTAGSDVVEYLIKSREGTL